MRSLPNVLVVVVVAAVLPGCPFESRVPLGLPAPHDADTRFTGNWIWNDPDGKDDACLMSIRPFNESEYLVTLQEKDKAPGEFRAFQVQVGDQVFWNVNEVETSFPPKTYLIARCLLTTTGELSLKFVGEDCVPKTLASDAASLTTYLKAHLNDGSLDDKEKGLLVWRRPKQGEWEMHRKR